MRDLLLELLGKHSSSSSSGVQELGLASSTLSERASLLRAVQSIQASVQAIEQHTIHRHGSKGSAVLQAVAVQPQGRTGEQQAL